MKQDLLFSQMTFVFQNNDKIKQNTTIDEVIVTIWIAELKRPETVNHQPLTD